MQRSVSFPTTIVDGFFDNPDLVREFALKQDYMHDMRGNWPGKRCDLLTASPILSHKVAQKVLLLFFDGITQYNVTSFFQIVEKKYGTGWIHTDSGDNNIISGIIYLSPGVESGTSLYSKNRPFEYSDHTLLDKKVRDYNSINEGHVLGNTPDYAPIHNSEFKETVRISGVYNRLVLFDSNLYHGAHDFYGENFEDSRLTMVFFINKINCDFSTLPIPRMSMKLGDNAI